MRSAAAKPSRPRRPSFPPARRPIIPAFRLPRRFPPGRSVFRLAKTTPRSMCRGSYSNVSAVGPAAAGLAMRRSGGVEGIACRYWGVPVHEDRAALTKRRVLARAQPYDAYAVLTSALAEEVKLVPVVAGPVKLGDSVVDIPYQLVRLTRPTVPLNRHCRNFATAERTETTYLCSRSASRIISSRTRRNVSLAGPSGYFSAMRRRRDWSAFKRSSSMSKPYPA